MLSRNSFLLWIVTQLFLNDCYIKSIHPIKDDELADFKSAYWSTVEPIKRWNDYDLINYIKKSYQEFKNRNKEELVIYSMPRRPFRRQAFQRSFYYNRSLRLNFHLRQ